MIRWFHVEPTGGLVCGSPPPGFRFLHDELAGGIFAGGHIQYKSTYNCEDVIILTDPADYTASAPPPTVAYSLTNGEINLPAISSDFPTSTRMRLFNHLDFSSFFDRSAPPGPGWNGADFMSSGGSFAVSSRSQSDPFTMAMVIDGMDNIILGSFIMQGNVNPRIHVVNASTTRFWMGTSFTNYAGKNYSSSLFRQAGLKLVVAVWDGSNLPAGANIYINDMTTALTGTNASGGVFSDTPYSNVSINSDQSVNTITKELHMFNYAMDATDRGTLKTILEQYYTFT